MLLESNAHVATLTSLGIPDLHATDLIAMCKATGMLLLPPMLRYPVRVGGLCLMHAACPPST